MRLKRLRLRNYGCFADLDLELAAEPGRITLITAPNGAGKSVLLQAFHDLLFDIPMQSPMKFRHGYPGMGLHADAVATDGIEFSFGWERGGRPQRVTSDAARFAALRNGVTPQQLESLFALDTTRLRKGGTDLKGGATLSEALLAGTGELASAKAVRSVIEKRRDENWGKRKSTPPLNAAASRVEETRKRVRDAVERPEAREREERALAERERELDQARKERADAAEETRRINRIALTRPHLLALEEAESWLLANPDAPALPIGLDTALATAREKVVLARTRHEDAEQALRRATDAVERIVRDPSCSRLADRLGELPGMLGNAETSAKHIVDRGVEHAAKMESIRAGLRRIGSDIPEQRAEEVIPTVGLKAEVQAAITEEARLRTALELARAGVAKARADLARAEGELTAVEPLPDDLIALSAEIRADRNPVVHAEETEAASVTAAAEVRRVLALVPGWTGTAEELRAVPLPPEADFERLDAARIAAVTAAEAARSLRVKLAEEDGNARASLAALREHELPDTASVLAARAERDRGMRLVLARAYGVPPSATEEAVFAKDEPMPLAYERHVREADKLADRRTAELERVQESERLSRAIEALAEPLRQAASDEDEAFNKLSAAEGDWAQAVAPLDLGPSTTIGELRQACAARRMLVDALAKSEVAGETQAALTRRHLAWAGRLAASLGIALAPLGSLLATADQRVSAAQKSERAATKRQAILEGARRAVPEATNTLDEAVAAMDRWRDGWAGLLKRLRRPPGEFPVAVAAVLETVSALEAHHRDGLSLAKRVGDMQADLDRFAVAVSVLAQEVGQAEGASAAEAARGLIARAAVASTAEAAWGQARQTMGTTAEAEETARGELRDARAKLDAVIASCGAEDAEGAEARIVASRAHADQVARRDAARANLLDHGDGFSVAALRIEADAVSVEEMVARRQAAEDSATFAQSRAEEASVALNSMQAALNQASASTEAIEARADYEAAIAAFERLLEDQLVLHLASTMLGNAMREVEDGMGGSALARTSEAFSAVTDGAYALESHDGPAGEELNAVERAFPNERKALIELSEGTRDQLYLALRMEALRGHCKSAMAVPFIADDILQTFDDGRARAALLALRELSANLQVIVLTHHPHLQAVAETLGQGSVRSVRL